MLSEESRKHHMVPHPLCFKNYAYGSGLAVLSCALMQDDFIHIFTITSMVLRRMDKWNTSTSYMYNKQ